MSLESKLGSRSSPLPSAIDASARLEAYERVSRAALVRGHGSKDAPVLQLSDEQLTALFAPRQLEQLVKRPLHREQTSCN